jgi:LmbE family N-acetylglucosaminyl deacetylase
MATVDRTYLQELMPSVQGTGIEVTPEMTEMFETIGVPGARVTTEIDVRRFLDVKRSAMRAHASQIGDTGFFLAMSDDVFTAVWGNEWYVRVRPDAGSHDGLFAREPSLLG